MALYFSLAVAKDKKMRPSNHWNSAFSLFCRRNTSRASALIDVSNHKSVAWFSNTLEKNNYFDHDAICKFGDMMRMHKRGISTTIDDDDNSSMNVQMHCCYCLANRVDHKPTTTTFNTILKGLNVVEAEKLFNKLLRQKLCDSNENMLLLTIVNGLCRYGRAVVALDLLEVLEKGVFTADLKIYRTLFDRLSIDKLADIAHQGLLTFSEKEILSNVAMYNRMIPALCKLRKYKEVKKLLDVMVSCKVFPSILAFNKMVDAFCKEGNVVEAENVLQIMTQGNISPDIVTYTILIDGYCLQGEMQKARKIFDSIEDKGLKPSIITCDSLINGYCKNGNVDEAWQLFLQIPRIGLQDTAVIYSSMLQGLFRAGRFAAGWELFNEMEARQVVTNLQTYNILLGGLCENQLISEACSIRDVMEHNGVNPDIVSYNILIRGLCKNGKLHLARNLFNELPSKGLQPDDKTFNIVIGALCEEGMTEEAKNLLVKMEKIGGLPNSVTYNVRLHGFLKSKKFFEVIPLLEEMMRREVSLNDDSLLMLVNHLPKE